jgi:hypothetical protein
MGGGAIAMLFAFVVYDKWSNKRKNNRSITPA